MNKNRIALITNNAQTITNLKKAIDATFKHKKEDPDAWHNATQEFHERYDLLAFPGGLEMA